MAVGSAQWLTVVYLVCTVLSAQAMQCKGTAKYTLTFQGEWSNASHPKDFPSDPHFSSLVGCSHNASYVMWIPGEKATKGVKDVAETGRSFCDSSFQSGMYFHYFNLNMYPLMLIPSILIAYMLDLMGF